MGFNSGFKGLKSKLPMFMPWRVVGGWR